MPILGKRSLFLDAGLFWEREVYFWSTHHMWQKSNMQKMREKQHARDERKEACGRWRKRNMAHM
jgi:hypothetical protein